MTSDPRPASERAAELRARILAVVERDGFRLQSDVYLTTDDSDEVCIGCALGAAAYALGARPWSTRGVSALDSKVKESGLATADECIELEGGFENWTNVDRSRPFAALGVELRSLAEKAAP